MTFLDALPAVRTCELQRQEQLPSGRGGMHEMGLVERGTIMLASLLADGRRQVLSFRLAGEAFCAGGFAGGIETEQGQRSYAVAVETSTVRFGSIAPLIGNDWEAAALPVRLVELACRQAREACEQITVLGKLGADERVAHFLLDMAARQHGWIGDGSLVELPMTRDDIGDYLGLNALTVTRALGRLRKQGLITVPEAHTVLLQQTERLAAVAPFLSKAAARKLEPAR